MAIVEDAHRRVVLRVVGRAVALVADQGCLHLRRKVLAQPVRLRWRAKGLMSDGTVPPGKVVALRAWPGAHAVRITLLVLATGPSPARFVFELGIVMW